MYAFRMGMSQFAAGGSAYQKLVDALAAGWHVQPPIYFRRQWHDFKHTSDGYTFILKRGAETEAIVVPADDNVRQLIALQRLQVMAT